MRKAFIYLIITALSVSNLLAQKPDQYKLKKGDQFKVTAVVEQEISQSMLGQEIETTQSITTIDRYEVVKVNDNEIHLETTGISRSLETNTAGGSVLMDSDLEGDEHLAFRVLTGKSYTVVMNNYGRFLRFERMEEFQNKVRAELKGTILESEADNLLTGFENEALSTAFEGQFYIYPEPGKQWNRSASMMVNNLPIDVDYDFRRENAETIIAEGKMQMAGEFEVMEQVMQANMSGDQKSEFKLDRKSGLPLSIITTQDMGGTLNVSEIEVPMNLVTTVKVTIVK